MGNIYFYLIIGFIFFKIARFLIKYRNIYKLLGYKHVMINGNIFIIKKMSPIDFMEESTGCPLTIFEYKKGVTLMDQVRGEVKESSMQETEIKQRIKLARTVLEKCIIHYPTGITAKALLESDSKEAVKIAWDLYGKILGNSFRTLTKIYKMERQYIIHIAELCNKLSTTPSKHLDPDGALSGIEKYIIDEFIFNCYIDYENKNKAKGK